MQNILEYTFEKLSQSIYTRTIQNKLESSPHFNRHFSEKICNLVFELCNNDKKEYDNALTSFENYCKEFLVLQMELEKTGHYKYNSYEDLKEHVYNNSEHMESTYLRGILLSQALWINHVRIFDFYQDAFTSFEKNNGTMLEVPIGSGIFSSVFAELHPNWKIVGYDLSPSSVDFAKKLIKSNNSHQERFNITLKNIFDIDESTQYDRITCGEVIEHVLEPEKILEKLAKIIKTDGKLFLTTAVWAAAIDHIYLFKDVQEVRDMLSKYFVIEKELALTVFDTKDVEDSKTPINCAFILSKE